MRVAPAESAVVQCGAMTIARIFPLYRGKGPWQDSGSCAATARHRRGARSGKPMTKKKRRSYEAGHSPKFLVVIDDSPECDRALYFASRRALRIGSTVLMLRVIETDDHGPQWLGVADIMRAEAHEEANAVLDRHASRAASITGVMPQRVIREGDKPSELLKLIEDDEDIALLVLAAATDKEGPGPLVSSLIRNAGEFPVPIALVPGNLTDEDLDTMA